MTGVTLIGEKLAKEGTEFAFGGCLSRCQNCEIKNSCCGLEKNKWYRITGVRENTHDCRVHKGDVRVVDVEQIPIRTAINGRTVVEGSTITLEENDCTNPDCDNYQLCHPTGIEPGEKYNVEWAGENIDCPGGKKLTEVKLL